MSIVLDGRQRGRRNPDRSIAARRVLYTFHVSLLVRQARPIRYHHLADLVPRSHLGITVVVLAAIHIVDRRSPLYFLDKPLRVEHASRFSSIFHSILLLPFASQFNLAPFAARRLDYKMKIFSRSAICADGSKNLYVTLRKRQWKNNLSTEAWKEIELKKSRKRSIGAMIDSPHKKQLSHHTGDSRLIGIKCESGQNGRRNSRRRSQPCASNVRRHVASSAAACASLRRNRCTASTALVSWRPGKCGCGCGAESMPPATLPDQSHRRAARGSRAGWKTAESRRRATSRPVRHVDAARYSRAGKMFFRILRYIMLLSQGFLLVSSKSSKTYKNGISRLLNNYHWL